MQGKLLLEQLMSGNPPRSNYSGSPHSLHNAPVRSSPPYPAHDPPEYRSPYVQAGPLELPEIRGSLPQSAPQSEPQQRSLFDFVSPFDALSSTSSTQVKKKPVPPQPSASSTEDSSWTAISDPKRRSVDNLLEQMTNSRPYPHSVNAYDFYDAAAADYPSMEPSRPLPQQPTEQKQAPAPPPLIPQPEQLVPIRQPESPPNRRSSPQRTQPQRARLGDSPAGSQQGGSRRDKDGSPGPRGGTGSIRRGRGGKNVANANFQPQTIVFDVSQQLEEIQAPRDFVKTTAIALVKQEPVFLPGTTIGATHWIAYAMSRGRVRVISRSNGDRTLLQLPSFYGNASVSDMAVHRNRLAGVTTDGGFVVWQLPEVITDDVPGRLILCVLPPQDGEPLQSVKWHPKESDTLAVASENQIYIIDLANVASLHEGPIPQSDLRHIGSHLTTNAPLVAFDFDILQQSLITISTDSVLTTWNTVDQVPYANVKIRGEDPPSSLTYADGIIVVGRKFGTVFQLLSASTKQVLSTLKFVNTAAPTEEMFGHACYDSRIQTLWIANSKRESVIAFKFNQDLPVFGEDRGFVDQVLEFTGPRASIHFVILTADSDPNGDEAYASCIAAKVMPSELALAGFSVHSGGVDQILVRKEWFYESLNSAASKFPFFIAPETKQQKPLPAAPAVLPPRPVTPEDVDADTYSREEPRAQEQKSVNNGGNSKGQKGGRNVQWNKDDGGNGGKSKEKEKEKQQDKEKDDGVNTLALSKEMKKLEETLHQRITKSFNKEMDKQHQRFEDARAHEQAEDFARQEKILKLISTELTRNTTRVVEVAVKNEVQNSVLPALENITKGEVRHALNDHVGRAVNELISHRIPNEMENVMLRPDFTGKLSQAIVGTLSAVIDRQVKQTVSDVVVPEVIALKSEITRWQSETSRNHDAAILSLERTVRALADQVKFLSSRPPSGEPKVPQQQQQQQMPPQMQQQMGPQMGPMPNPMQRMQHQHQQQPMGPMPPQQQQPPAPLWYSPDSQQAQAQPVPSWYNNRGGIAAPQPSHPIQPPPVEKGVTSEEMSKYEDQFLEALSSSSRDDLINLLARTNIDSVMPLRPDALTLSQTLVIVIIHRNTTIVEQTAPSDLAFKVAIQWLHRALVVLRLDDNMMVDYVPRVMPTTYRLLGVAEKRLALLPEKSPSTNDGISHLRDIRSIIERKIPSVTKMSASEMAGPMQL
ncbi:hypothetical protein CYLTODRAFT_375346 [Cylindrobasidium torrendii FP15055 ss-10]|uniref:Enhancer of mRNA-decapping protein 4 WD40 repeat region domain-containing protein n=1 Tax=Cylindrobasidium torrendii FP15055 ss-10 TaxID=1314674 RepID=A0A0D7BDY1_9AGAR|nr:hypothetical protein CYLTODRAFT_375346 [Cylindrobasidium torrendii FP15055 ss-10]